MGNDSGYPDTTVTVVDAALPRQANGANGPLLLASTVRGDAKSLRHPELRRQPCAGSSQGPSFSTRAFTPCNRHVLGRHSAACPIDLRGRGCGNFAREVRSSTRAAHTTRSQEAIPFVLVRNWYRKSTRPLLTSIGAPRFELGTSSPPGYSEGWRGLAGSGGKWLGSWLLAFQGMELSGLGPGTFGPRSGHASASPLPTLRPSDPTRESALDGTSPCPFHATSPRKPQPPRTPAPSALLPARLRSRDALWRPLTDAWPRSRR